MHHFPLWSLQWHSEKQLCELLSCPLLPKNTWNLFFYFCGKFCLLPSIQGIYWQKQICLFTKPIQIIVVHCVIICNWLIYTSCPLFKSSNFSLSRSWIIVEHHMCNWLIYTSECTFTHCFFCASVNNILGVQDLWPQLQMYEFHFGIRKSYIICLFSLIS